MILWRSTLDARMPGDNVDLIDNEYTLSFNRDMYNRHIDIDILHIDFGVEFKRKAVETVGTIYKTYM